MNLNEMVFTVGEAKSGLLESGVHNVRIAGIEGKVPEHKKSDFKDKDEQAEVTFKDKEGRQFRHYYNLFAYRLFAELSEKERESGKYIDAGGYALNLSTGLREKVPYSTPEQKKADGWKPNRSDQALSIFQGLAGATGLPLEANFKVADLLGRELTIVLGPEMNPVTHKMDVRLKAIRPLEALEV
jgi:hypothetical protein